MNNDYNAYQEYVYRNPNSDGYYSLVKHILLLIFTFGIWYYIWIYRVTGYCNRVRGVQQRSQTSQLLLCMFVPFYYIYWVYKTAQCIDRLAYDEGLSSDLSMLCLILSIFVNIVPPILMQDKINEIANVRAGIVQPGYDTYEPPYSQPQYTQSKAEPQTPPTAEQSHHAADIYEDLKKWKELLDMGAITQEEYDAKKKDLLGL